MKNKLMMFLLISFVWNGFAQESEWEPQKQITGYASTEFDYFKNIKYFKRDHGVTLAEGGLLCSYQPLQKLTIKSVFVYRPNLAFNDMLNELNAEWKFCDWLKVQGGRFLTPLSPVNTNYYAVANTAVTLPMLVSLHESYPISMNGIALKGSIGDNIKLNYNIFGGGYFTSMYLGTGAMGFFGNEANYFLYWDNMPVDTRSNSEFQTGGGGHVDISINDMFTLGTGVFHSNDNIYNLLPTGDVIPVKLKRDGFTINTQFKYNTLKLLAEYYDGHGDMIDFADIYTKVLYSEISNSFGKFTPYVRFEDHYSTVMEMTPNFSRYTVGINYRPIFEIAFKAEYMHYRNNVHNLDGFAGALVFSF